MNQDLNDLLEKAMYSEIKAREFYLDASEKAQSHAGKKLFKELAAFEQNHYNKVKKIIESKNSGIKIKESSSDVLKDFKSEIEGEFEPNKDEIINVLNLAIESEKEAQIRYEKIAEMFEEEVEKNIFNNMANDERNHQKILEHQFYHISNKGVIIWD
jgi:rubrerythrin